MRLIDADALAKEIKQDIADEGLTERFVFYRINNAPTIDDPFKEFKDKSIEQLMDECFTRGYQKAIRHGKWVVAGKTTHYYICSVCGEPGDGFDNYCRSCGARMEGAEE